MSIIRSQLAFAYLAASESQWHEAIELLAREQALRNEMGLPFPLDWEKERDFIERTATTYLTPAQIIDARQAGVDAASEAGSANSLS